MGGGGGKKLNFIFTIRYEIPTFLSVGPFFKEGGGGLENFGQKLKFLGFIQLRSPLSWVVIKKKQFLSRA